MVFATYFQAAGRGLPSLALSLLREILIFIPLLLIFSDLFGQLGVWYARPVSDFLAFVVTLALLLRDFRKQGIKEHVFQLSG